MDVSVRDTKMMFLTPKEITWKIEISTDFPQKYIFLDKRSFISR
jgi:hypothetical protein